MRKFAFAVAIALAATSAQAVLVCKNSKQQTLEWHSGKGKPDTSNFDVMAPGVVCFASNRAGEYLSYMNIPYIGGMPTAQPRAIAQGQIYSGDLARYIIWNIGIIEDQFNYEAEFANIKP